MTDLPFEPDEIGEWSERKIEIVSRYAAAYSKILANQPRLKHYYIDGFTGGGIAVRKGTGEPVETTARRILAIEPPFFGYHLIDADEDKSAAMKAACGARPNALAYCGDSNQLLPPIFKTIKYEQFCRALCFLDPYAIMLSWDVIAAAARSRTIEIFLNFPTVDIQRNVLRHNQSSVDPEAIEKMNRMWGDETWRDVAYNDVPDLFGARIEKQPIDGLLTAFANRLKKAAGFKYVSKPIAMRNRKNGIVYHLFFATPNETGLRIANHILQSQSRPKGRDYGGKLNRMD